MVSMETRHYMYSMTYFQLKQLSLSGIDVYPSKWVRLCVAIPIFRIAIVTEMERVTEIMVHFEDILWLPW